MAALVENHPIMSQLLTLIEGNPMWKVALGFYKGNMTSVPNEGKKVMDHYHNIATCLFTGPKGIGTWTDTDILKLTDVIKNHVSKYVCFVKTTLLCTRCPR